MGFVGDLIGGVGGAIAANEQADAQRDAARMAAQQYEKGYQRVGTDTNLRGIANTGYGATQGIAGLLGVGGDPAAQQAAFDNYLGSTGYNFQMQAGQDALGARGAATGKRISGAQDKALLEYGQGLGSQYFNNYLSQLGGLAGQGQSADMAIANAATGAAAGQAGQLGAGYAAAAQSTGDMYDNVFGTLGGVADNFFRPKGP